MKLSAAPVGCIMQETKLLARKYKERHSLKQKVRDGAGRAHPRRSSSATRSLLVRFRSPSQTAQGLIIGVSGLDMGHMHGKVRLCSTVEGAELQHRRRMAKLHNVGAAAQQRGSSELRISFACSVQHKIPTTWSGVVGWRLDMGLGCLLGARLASVSKSKMCSPRVTRSRLWGLGRSERLSAKIW